MKIVIKCEGEDTQSEIIVSNDQLANNNYVDIYTQSWEGVTVPVDEIYEAISAFICLRDSDWERDNQYGGRNATK